MNSYLGAVIETVLLGITEDAVRWRSTKRNPIRVSGIVNNVVRTAIKVRAEKAFAEMIFISNSIVNTTSSIRPLACTNAPIVNA